MEPALFRFRLNQFFSNRTNVVLLVVLALVALGLVWGLSLILGKKGPQKSTEIDLPFDPVGPYALLLPRRDGNALVLNITRVSAYDSISYELAYQSLNDAGQLVDRGVTGTIDTKDKKSDYSQEILFGTCSRGNTRDPLHCVFDKNVENGTLTLRIQQERTVYKMLTAWHLQKPDLALGRLSSADGHFDYVVRGTPEASAASQTARVLPADLKQALSLTGFTIINDLSGVPKLPEGKKILGKVYAFNAPSGRDFLPGRVSIELAENPPPDARIGFFKTDVNGWSLLDTTISGAILTADGPGSGIFAVLIGSTNTSR